MEQFRNAVRDKDERHMYDYKKIALDISRKLYYFKKETTREESSSEKLFCFFSSLVSVRIIAPSCN